MGYFATRRLQHELQAAFTIANGPIAILHARKALAEKLPNGDYVITGKARSRLSACVTMPHRKKHHTIVYVARRDAITYDDNGGRDRWGVSNASVPGSGKQPMSVKVRETIDVSCEAEASFTTRVNRETGKAEYVPDREHIRSDAESDYEYALRLVAWLQNAMGELTAADGCLVCYASMPRLVSQGQRAVQPSTREHRALVSQNEQLQITLRKGKLD